MAKKPEDRFATASAFEEALGLLKGMPAAAVWKTPLWSALTCRRSWGKPPQRSPRPVADPAQHASSRRRARAGDETCRRSDAPLWAPQTAGDWARCQRRYRAERRARLASTCR